MRLKLLRPSTKAGKAGMVAVSLVAALVLVDLFALAATAVYAAGLGLR